MKNKIIKLLARETLTPTYKMTCLGGLYTKEIADRLGESQYIGGHKDVLNTLYALEQQKVVRRVPHSSHNTWFQWGLEPDYVTKSGLKSLSFS